MKYVIKIARQVFVLQDKQLFYSVLKAAHYPWCLEDLASQGIKPRFPAANHVLQSFESSNWPHRQFFFFIELLYR